MSRPGALRVLIFESLAGNGKGLRVRGRVEQGPPWPPWPPHDDSRLLGVLRPGRCMLAGQACQVDQVLQRPEAMGGQTVELQLSGSLPDWPSMAGATAPAWRGRRALRGRGAH